MRVKSINIKKSSLIIAMLVVMVIGFSNVSFAVLPNIAFDSGGTTNYYASTNILSINATPIIMELENPAIPGEVVTGYFVIANSSYSINVVVDNDGNLVPGSGTGLVVTGPVAVFFPPGVFNLADFSGDILIGEVQAFEAIPGTTSQFNFHFKLTGGFLVDSGHLPQGMDFIVNVTSENSDFSGDFNVNFTGKAKGTSSTTSPSQPECELLDVEKNCLVTTPPSSGDDCEGKVIQMTLEYTGGSCDASAHSQDPRKVKCKDYKELDGSEEVRIIVSDKKGKKKFADGNVTPGQTIVVDAANARKRHLKSTTHVKILKGKKLVQRIKFHTSCSQPLNVGDQFGGVSVVALNTTNGGLAELTDPPAPSQECEVPFPGADVQYIYTITNNSTTENISNISVVDDPLGVIGGSPILSLSPGATEILYADAFVSEEITNTVTVTGTVGADGQTCSDSASATVSVGEPPPPLLECTTKIVAMRLRYIGPSFGETVDVKLLGKRKPGALALYSGITLEKDVTVLSDAGENGWTIDATAEGLRDLGSKTTIWINDTEEVIHTSCSVPFVVGAPAPLDGNSPGHPPKGSPSPNWEVMGFIQK
ncbi:hypothetical protein ACFL0M_01865 [Thermodesulfobacteriota bacterium]